MDKFGLIASLRLLAGEMKMQHGLSCKADIVGLQRRISSESELALFRIAQEALYNVTKHAEATEVTIRLAFDKERTRIEVIDNGCFELSEVLSSFAHQDKLGLMTMTERPHLLRGGFSIE